MQKLKNEKDEPSVLVLFMCVQVPRVYILLKQYVCTWLGWTRVRLVCIIAFLNPFLVCVGSVLPRAELDIILLSQSAMIRPGTPCM